MKLPTEFEVYSWEWPAEDNYTANMITGWAYLSWGKSLGRDCWGSNQTFEDFQNNGPVDGWNPPRIVIDWLLEYYQVTPKWSPEHYDQFNAKSAHKKKQCTGFRKHILPELSWLLTPHGRERMGFEEKWARERAIELFQFLEQLEPDEFKEFGERSLERYNEWIENGTEEPYTREAIASWEEVLYNRKPDSFKRLTAWDRLGNF